MAGVSKLTRAKSMAMLALQLVPPECKKETMQNARERVYQLHRCAAEMRGAYKTNKRARESIKHTNEAAWELADLLDNALENWETINRAGVAVYAYAVVQYLDSVDADDQAMADAALEKIRHLLPAKPRDPQLTEVAQNDDVM